MKYYKCQFFDNRDQQIHEHYVFTANIEKAKARIELEEPYVKLQTYIAVEEHQLPDLCVVISK